MDKYLVYILNTNRENFLTTNNKDVYDVMGPYEGVERAELVLGCVLTVVHGLNGWHINPYTGQHLLVGSKSGDNIAGYIKKVEE